MKMQSCDSYVSLAREIALDVCSPWASYHSMKVLCVFIVILWHSFSSGELGTKCKVQADLADDPFSIPSIRIDTM